MPGEPTSGQQRGGPAGRRPEQGRQPVPRRPQGGVHTVGQPPGADDGRTGDRTYNPIRGWRRLPTVHLFRPRLEPGPGIALVLQRDSGVLTERMPAEGSISLGVVTDVRTVYQIDVSEHTLRFSVRLPCSRDPHEFIASLAITCAISRPAQVVDRWLTDVRRLLEPGLEEVMRGVSGGFGVEDRAWAEQELRRALRERASGDGLDMAVWVRGVGVSVRLDEATEAHLKWLTEAERDIDRSRLYAVLLERGDWSLLALHLERNRDRVMDALAHISQQQQLSVDTRIRGLRFLLEHDIIDAEQLAEAGERGVLGRDIIDALDLSRPAQPPEPSRDGEAAQPASERPRGIRTVRPADPNRT